PRREVVLPRRGGRRRLPGHRVRALLFVEPLRRSAGRPELPREPLGRGGFAATREALDKDYPCVHTKTGSFQVNPVRFRRRVVLSISSPRNQQNQGPRERSRGPSLSWDSDFTRNFTL